MDRRYCARRIARLDPDRDCHEIYRLLVTCEFPWDFNQSLARQLRAGALRLDEGSLAVPEASR